MQHALKLKIMPEEAFRIWKDDLGLTDRDLLGALDPDQHEARDRLAALMHLHERLSGTFDDAAIIREWLDTPNRYLGRMKPVDAIRVGCFAQAEAALEAFKSGAFV